jgi:Icc-related predicted phosphoesterase
VSPSPFLLKDWEKYDVSRFTGVGDVSPEEGIRTVEVPPEIVKYTTIDDDLRELAALSDPKSTIYLFHSPPYETCLDRVDSDGKFVDHAPVDTHVGSIAIKRFLEREEPFLTLHGHIHESSRLTGNWRERIGSTHVFGASHDGPGLAIVRFDVASLENARRDVILP